MLVNVYNMTVKLRVVHIVLETVFSPFVRLLLLNLAHDFRKLPFDG